MKAAKRIISDLTLCYCVAPVTFRGKRHFAVASEKEHACLLFDESGNQVDKIWDGPGGTMTIVALPGVDGAFLATHKFYSPNNSKEAKIVMCRYNEGAWEVHTLAELPFVHRFDILQRDGECYLLACCLKSDYEYKDDWRFPGKTFGCKLPSDLSTLWGSTLELTLLKDAMLKNHGYCRHIKDGIMTGLVASEEGVFRFTPPEKGGEEWLVEQLVSDATSDAVMADLDGDGEEELLTIAPFHGDALRVYHKAEAGYTKVYEYENPIEFAHAICAAEIFGRNTVIIGHRKGNRDLLAVTCRDGSYNVEVLDHDIGPANVLHFNYEGREILLSANREINEVAYYELTNE